MIHKMTRALKKPGSQPMAFRIARQTSKIAFDVMTSKELGRGLVFTSSTNDPQIGEVHYDRDPSYPHECLGPTFSAEMSAQLQSYGELDICFHVVWTFLGVEPYDKALQTSVVFDIQQ